MIDRRIAREAALQLLYKLDIEFNLKALSKEKLRVILNEHLDFLKITGVERDLAFLMVSGIISDRDMIDEMIDSAMDNWTLDRLAAIDRNILRLGAYELLKFDDVDYKITFNEAIEIAKRFSSGQSGKFVNGVLDRLYRNLITGKSTDRKAWGE